MSAVWVVRDKDGRFCYAYPSIIEAMDAADSDGTVTRETLLTPAHAAVMEAAKVMADFLLQPLSTDGYGEWMVAKHGLLAAVATLRELEEET